MYGPGQSPPPHWPQSGAPVPDAAVVVVPALVVVERVVARVVVLDVRTEAVVPAAVVVTGVPPHVYGLCKGVRNNGLVLKARRRAYTNDKWENLLDLG